MDKNMIRRRGLGNGVSCYLLHDK